MTNPRLPALLALALATTPLASAGTATTPLPSNSPNRVAPAPNCMDARGLREMNQVSDTHISLRAADQSTWKVTFKESCPGLMASPNPQILAEESWVCGTGQERVVADGKDCGIASVQPMTRKDFAEEARQADRGGIATLAAVNVKESKRTLRGSTSYCFDTRHVRSYGDNIKGFTVQTNPSRSGGNREYVVEVGANCRALMHSPAIQFRSGFGTSLICGNPGDVVVMISQPNAPGGGDATGEDLSFINRSAGLPRASLGIGDRCDVLAVYPAG